MKELLKEITCQIENVFGEAHYEVNRSNTVKYPYLTFTLDGEEIERNTDGYTIDINIFDRGKSYGSVFEIEGNLKAHFKDKIILNDNFMLRFWNLRANTIPTGDDILIRRNLQIYCKVYWRG